MAYPIRRCLTFLICIVFTNGINRNRIYDIGALFCPCTQFCNTNDDGTVGHVPTVNESTEAADHDAACNGTKVYEFPEEGGHISVYLPSKAVLLFNHNDNMFRKTIEGYSD